MKKQLNIKLEANVTRKNIYQAKKVIVVVATVLTLELVVRFQIVIITKEL
jgi:hypothetical protein